MHLIGWVRTCFCGNLWNWFNVSCKLPYNLIFENGKRIEKSRKFNHKKGLAS